jgi:hypothetical protein
MVENYENGVNGVTWCKMLKHGVKMVENDIKWWKMV